jgi:hypothetical protein
MQLFIAYSFDCRHAARYDGCDARRAAESARCCHAAAPFQLAFAAGLIIACQIFRHFAISILPPLPPRRRHFRYVISSYGYDCRFRLLYYFHYYQIRYFHS